jgi:asparagine synthase (glutamine-hydrolysing)
MCGFVAIFDTREQRPVESGLLHHLTRLLEHRGPDGEGYYIDAGVGLGHRRLAIIDRAGGQQPMFNEDRSVSVVFNGEIYNFATVRKDLIARGHVFETGSDTEVIVHGWEEWGEECVDRYRGMFAFALWDARSATLFLARDRLGIKPLYYAVTASGMLIAASELKSIMGYPGVSTCLDPAAIDDYLTFGYVPEPRTIYQAVHKLSPGHSLKCVRGAAGISPREYWDVSFARKSGVTLAEAEGQLLDELNESVRLRMISEVPIGAFLSGGVDSSAVVAAMAMQSADPIRTCAIAFQDQAYDETHYAEQVASRYGTRHSVDEVSADQFDTLGRLPELFDEPFADSSALPTLEVCRMARKYVTVALSGDGGDENFGGYGRYRIHNDEMRLRMKLPPVIGATVFRGLGRLYPPLRGAPRWLRAKATFEALGYGELDGYLAIIAVTPERLRQQFYTPRLNRELQGYHPLSLLQDRMRGCDATTAVERMQYLDLKTYLPGDILTKVDRTSMAHSLEVRVPLLDHKLTEWAAGLSNEQKFGAAGEGKRVLKSAMEKFLPRELLYRRKMGFAIPVTKWMRTTHLDVVRDMAKESAVLDSGLIDRAGLAKAVEDHAAGRYENSGSLWALLVLDQFLRKSPATLGA